MAHSKSAKKRVRQNLTRRLRNRRRKSAVKESVRVFEADAATGQSDQAAADLKEASKRLDRTAAKGAIHKKAAARKKSRLARRLNKMTAG